MAVRAGLQERALLANSESLAHYRRGQELLAEDSIDLAIAEFERAIKLNPTFREARQALREAQQVSLAQPTPTSETRTAAAADIFAQAEAQLAAENWSDAIFTLSQVRDLDSAFQPEQVAELMFTAHYQRGLQLLRPDQLAEALTEFEAALAERPTDPDATTERRKAALYLTATDPDVDLKDAVRALVQLQRLDDSYLDVSQLLPRTYHAYGDELGRSGEWCLAQAQFAAALELQPGTTTGSDNRHPIGGPHPLGARQRHAGRRSSQRHRHPAVQRHNAARCCSAAGQRRRSRTGPGSAIGRSRRAGGLRHIQPRL
jgi:tetratricopeptide (TPR) repeat protein